MTATHHTEHSAPDSSNGASVDEGRMGLDVRPSHIEGTERPGGLASPPISEPDGPPNPPVGRASARDSASARSPAYLELPRRYDVPRYLYLIAAKGHRARRKEMQMTRYERVAWRALRDPSRFEARLHS